MVFAENEKGGTWQNAITERHVPAQLPQDNEEKRDRRFGGCVSVRVPRA